MSYPEHEKFSHPGLTQALLNMVEAAMLGSDPNFWYTGVISAVQSLSAEQASKIILPNYSSIADHAYHVCISLNYMRRTLEGETVKVDWRATWAQQQVNTEQWNDLRERLQVEYDAMTKFIREKSFWLEESLTQLLDNISHAAYHAGAIRQLAKGVEQ
jgi:uncharacterized damage-inducible protein DinB